MDYKLFHYIIKPYIKVYIGGSINFMKKINIFFKALARSTVFYTKPVKARTHSLLEKREKKIMIFSILLTNLVGVGFLGVSTRAFTLINVGSFLGVALSMLPSHFNPFIKCSKGIILIALGASLGIFFSSHKIIITILFCLGLFIAGILWRFNNGEYVRFRFFSFAVIASSEIRESFQTEKIWLGLLAIIFGMVVVSLIFLSLYKGTDSVTLIVVNLYQELYSLAKGEESDYINARIKAWSVLELSPKINLINRLWILELVRYSDAVASSLTYRKSEEDIDGIKYIILRLKKDSSATLPDLNQVNDSIKSAIDVLTFKNKSESVNFKSLFYNINFKNEIKRIFSEPKNSNNTLILRLVLTGLACHLLSLLLAHIFNFPLSNHEFWIPISGCLMVMPGYYGTFGKVSSSFIGSLIGCASGGLLFLLLPTSGILHLITYIIIGCSLVLLYSLVKSINQAFLMFSVTVWLSFILGGYNAGYTRIIDVILAAIITMAVLFIVPTYHDEDFNKNIRDFTSKFIEKDFQNLNSINLQELLKDLYSTQEQLNRSIVELKFDSSLYNLEWSLSELSEVHKITESILLGLIQVYNYTDSIDREKAEVLKELINYQDKLRELIYRKNQASTPQPIKDTFDNTVYLPVLNRGVRNLVQIIQNYRK